MAAELSERVAVVLETGEWMSKEEAERKKKQQSEADLTDDLKADLAMAQASKMVGYDPPPAIKAELKKQVLARSGEELRLRAIADAAEDEALSQKCDGDATAIRRLREGLRLDKNVFKAQAPMHTFPRGSEDTVARLLSGYHQWFGPTARGDEAVYLTFKERTNKTLEEEGAFGICLVMELAMTMNCKQDPTFKGIEDTPLYPSLTLLMQERLGVHVYEAKMRFGDGFCSINPNDPSLVHLKGATGLTKLWSWVSTVFQVTGIESTSASGGWELPDVLYTLAYMLWTKSDFYSDLKSLMQWLETANLEEICLLLMFKVFSKVFSEDCCSVMMCIAEHIQGWVVQLKQNIEKDVSTIHSVVQSLSMRRDDPGVPSHVTELAELAANKAHAKLKSIIPPFSDKKGGDWSTAEDEVKTRAVEHACFEARVDGEPCYTYPLIAWEKALSMTHVYFMNYRKGRNARPAYVNSILDWPEPLPYESVGVEDPRFPLSYATSTLANVSHKRSFGAHLLMIELRGALGWMDQQFHPLSAWTLHVHQLLKRSIYLNRGMRGGTAIGKNAYKAAMRQMRACATAMVENDPDAFRRNMGVFSEKMFADESLTSCDNSRNCLSSDLGHLLSQARAGQFGGGVYTHEWVPGYIIDDKPLPDPDAPREQMLAQNAAIQSEWPKLWTWMVIINELAAKMDHVAVLVVDALCIGLTSLFPNASHSEHLYSFGDMIFHTGFKFAQAVNACTKFKDTTAPIYLCSYWRQYVSGVQLSLEAASRIACSYIARARFPETLYTEMVDHSHMMYRLFVRRYKVDMATNGYCFGDDGGRSLTGLGGRSTADFAKSLPLREELKASVDHCHFGGWTRQQKLIAASAMCKFAQDHREPIHRHQQEKLNEALPEDHAFGVRTRRHEGYVNLDMARVLVDLVLAQAGSCGSSSTTDHMLDTENARTIGLEIDATKKAWMNWDNVFDRKVTMAQKEKRKREARAEREREKAAAAVVSRCAQAAINAVLNEARIRDNEAKIRQLEEDNLRRERIIAENERRIAAYQCIARFVSWTPRVVRRKARRVEREAERKARHERQLAWEAAEAKAREEEAKAREAREVSASALREAVRARAIACAVERNRAAVKRREAALAKRAKVEQRALAQERREATKARTQAYKAEQAERNARIQAEVESTERARQEREAKAAAAAAEAARKAREQEATRVAEEQRRRDADAKLAAELQEKEKAAVLAAERERREAAEHAAKKVAEAEAERARRAEQSRVERLVNKHAKELARDRFAKAFALWRARARATHTARSVRETRAALLVSRRAEQERCNAIFREGLKEAEEAKAANKAKAEREREARLQADRVAHQAAAAEKAKAEATKQRPSWDVLRVTTASSSSSSPLPSSPETVTTCSPGPASPETVPYVPSQPASEAPAAAPASATPFVSTPSICRAAAAEARAIRATQPPLPKEPAPPHKYNFTEADVQRNGEKRCDGGAQWEADYREALAVAQMTSQNEWMNQTGWATNRVSWFNMGGHALVMQQQLAQQQRDQHTATFHANCKHMARVRAEAHTALKKRLAERWNAQLNKEAELRSALEYEELRLRELETEIAEMEKTKEERRTRYAVLREYLDGLEAATEAERRELSAKRCEQLRNRTGTYDACLGVNECIFCFEKPCDQIATPCNHVLGCEACVVKHRNAKGPECPICREPATFEMMHLP